MGAFLLFLIVVCGIVYLLRRKGDTPPASAETVFRFVPSPSPLTGAPSFDPTEASATWVPPGGRATVRGIELPGGMIYLGSRLAPTAGIRRVDPALIDPALATSPSHLSNGDGMGYWPSYSDIGPSNRGAYLSWLAGGRRDPSAYIGYVFLFFYGLERRVLVDRGDIAPIRAEVRRLLSIYSGNNSFRGYATDFLTVTLLDRLASIDDNTLHSELGELAPDNGTAIAGFLAWYQMHRRPLPAQYAALVAASMEDAKRGVVVKRSRKELLDLFSLRYREKYGSPRRLVGAVPLIRDVARS